MPGDYKSIKYEADGEGMATVTLNRPERMNAFNRQMSGELVLALDRFAHAEDEKVLILTGAGRAFSTGEDLRNIKLDASDIEMRQYAKEALRDYHNIIRAILCTGKPIVAFINGVAAGAGLSIALACDYRFVIGDIAAYWDTKIILVPAFADMGLVADCGMTETLSRLIGKQESQKWCEYSGHGATGRQAEELGILDEVPNHMMDFRLNYDAKVLSCVKVLVSFSPVAFGLSKKNRNQALVSKLNKRVFPWELRAQTACLQSDYFKEKARAFLAKQKAVEVS